LEAPKRINFTDQMFHEESLYINASWYARAALLPKYNGNGEREAMGGANGR
jgi:hypothetical protein